MGDRHPMCQQWERGGCGVLHYLPAVSRGKEQPPAKPAAWAGGAVNGIVSTSGGLNGCKVLHFHPLTGIIRTGCQFAPWQNKPGPPGSAPDVSPVNAEEGNFQRLTFIPHDKSLNCNLLGWYFFFIWVPCEVITWWYHCFCTTKHLFILLWEALIPAGLLLGGTACCWCGRVESTYQTENTEKVMSCGAGGRTCDFLGALEVISMLPFHLSPLNWGLSLCSLGFAKLSHRIWKMLSFTWQRRLHILRCMEPVVRPFLSFLIAQKHPQ